MNGRSEVVDERSKAAVTSSPSVMPVVLRRLNALRARGRCRPDSMQTSRSRTRYRTCAPHVSHQRVPFLLRTPLRHSNGRPSIGQ